MLKTYTINGKEYQTITIPKGTVLFRGLSFENKSKYESLFNDLIGLSTGHGYGIAPTMNVFFYPVPYVSDSVNIYNVHVMYITQYDIELILLVWPSSISRANKNTLDPKQSPITRCDHISKTDKCGFRMSEEDPCLTDHITKFHPHINGYIGLAENDVSIFTKKYKKMVTQLENYERASQILPAIISNSRDLSGIPEIVIHPLRFRHEDCLILRQRFYSPERIKRYSIIHRAQYNYFPLLYFTNNGIFTFNELKDEKNIELIAKSIRVDNGDKIPKLYDYINDVFSAMLKDGYTIDGTTYRVLVDRRTGFYVALIDKNSKNTIQPTNKNKKRITQKKIKREGTGDGFEGYLDAYIVSPTNNTKINSILSRHSKYIDEDLLKNLYINDYTLKKTLVLSRKNKNKFSYSYYIDKVIDRPELEKYAELRHIRNRHTLKNINSAFEKQLSFDGFTLGDLEDVSSVESM